MGKLVKLLGSGVGLAAEAIAHQREKSKAKSSQASGSANPSSTSLPAPSPVSREQSVATHADVGDDDLPPAYIELEDDRANELIKAGKAAPIAEKDYKQAQQYASKAQEAGYDDDELYDEVDEDHALAGDSAIWELDEMADRVAPHEQSEAAVEAEAEAAAQAPDDVKAKKEEEMLRVLVEMAGPPPQPSPRLPVPVIIPQRRPRNKDRGFVRAYAPVLEDSGISEDFFLKFLKDWYIASKASPWIDVIFISAAIVGFVPSVAAMVTATVVQVVAGTARELQSRYRRNTFLDKVNDEIFMPRGLYAMIMSFKEDLPGQQAGGPLSRLANGLGGTLFKSEHLDVNQTAAKYSNPEAMSKTMQKLKNIRLKSGKTYTQLELPEAAPLVYPSLDRAAAHDLQAEAEGKAPQGSSKGKWKSAGKFVQGYLDRRAQATYEADHPRSALAVPADAQGRFLTRWGDPNHPTNSGSLISLLTGGAINPEPWRQQRRDARYDCRSMHREYRDMRREAMGRAPRGPPRPPRTMRDKKGDARSLIGKIFQQDVLYLIIVNLPTKEEMDQSVALLEQAVGQAERSQY